MDIWEGTRNLRTDHVGQLYDLLQIQQNRDGGFRYLQDQDWKSRIPDAGVHFFFDPREPRITGDLRVVRVGSHALREGEDTSLIDRLENHMGKGGRSVFRRHVLSALQTVDERGDLGVAVTDYICRLPFVCLSVSERTNRKIIESNAIALLSNVNRMTPDVPSEGWLGRYAMNKMIVVSGLWNVRHVTDKPDPSVIDDIRRSVVHATL